MKTMILLLVLAAAGTLVWGLLSRAKSGEQGDGKAVDVTTKLPSLLAKAKIWGKEMSVACRAPRRMHGTFDEAFQLDSGDVVVSETKSRDRITVHKSDVIQLSAYALAVGEGGRQKVLDKGFVRLVTPRGNEYVGVDLLGEREVVKVYDKYMDLVSGKSKGDKCGKPGLCRTCLYKKECDAME
jgi:CRISPR/Cas system-associated exonuclease Cas4 (RecB family)